MSPDTVFDVLVKYADAHESLREQFQACWPECREFRFCGSLGFGGKVWAPGSKRHAPTVDCYPEDETPERRAVIATTNAALRRLYLGLRENGSDRPQSDSAESLNDGPGPA